MSENQPKDCLDDNSIPPKSTVSAPIPRRHHHHHQQLHQHVEGLASLSPPTRVASSFQVRQPFDSEVTLRSFTPATISKVTKSTARRPSYGTIVSNRERHFNLDYPNDVELLSKLQLDPKSRFFSRSRPRTLDLPNLLPYKIEEPEEQAKFLSHIISHLYIAIKTLDLQGSLSVSAKDLAALKNVSGLSDVDLALETNLFEMSTELHGTDEEEEDELEMELEMSDSDEDDEEEEDDEEDEDLDGDRESTIQHKKSPKSAAVVGVRTWTHELLVWLKMKYNMPVSIRINLAKVYYAICLSRGQHINLKTYVRVFELLTKDQFLLYDYGLRLPWNSLCQELEHHFPSVDSGLVAFEKKDHKQLLRLASRANYFFDKDCLPEIYKRLVSQFSVTNSSMVMSSLSLLPSFFNEAQDEHDVRYYINSLFYMWLKLNKINGFDAQVTSRLGVISMSALTQLNEDNCSIKLGKFGIYTKEQMEFITNTLINSLSIMVEKYSSMKSKYFHGFASMIVFSMIGDSAAEDEGILYFLQTLTNAIQSYTHPSNTGDWTRPISKLVIALVYQFHKRFNSENQPDGFYYNVPAEVKLTPKVVTEFVKIFLPIVKIGIQSKKTNATDDYISTLQLLAFLDPNLVLESTLLDIYESLEGVISTHRVSIALRSIDTLSRFLVSTPIYRVHVTRLLTLSLPGIDSNDLEKTLQTLECFAGIANYAPFYDLTNGEGDSGLAMEFTQDHIEYLKRKMYLLETDEFVIDESVEIAALKSSTTAFKDLFKSLTERLILLIENLPDPNKSTGLENALATSLPKFFYILFEATSDELFVDFKNQFFEFIFNNTYHTMSHVVGEICGGIIKRYPKCFKSTARLLIDKIHEEIEENGAGGIARGDGAASDIIPRDQPLYWTLSILNECIGNAGEKILDMKQELVDLSFYLMDKVKGPIVFTSSYLVNQILQSVTKIRIKECRLISPNYANKNGVDERCWGAFWQDPNRFNQDNTTFDWFIPGEIEINFAIEFFHGHVLKSLENITSLIKQFDADVKSSKRSTDELTKNLLYLAYLLSGVSYLLDPSFEEDIPKLNSDKESLQQRLLLLKQIRAIKGVSNQKDIFYDNIQENMEKIMNDLSSDDLIDYMIDFDKLNEIIHEQEEIHDDIDKEIPSKPSTPDPIRVPHFDLSRPQSTIPTFDGSGRDTPQIDGINMSSVNPAITFRERSLYTSNYFFGNDGENRKYRELYLKVHKTRHLIGRSLHIIYKFLVENFRDNTKAFKNFLYVVNMWFSNVGRERILDSSHARISYGYVSYIQTINRIRKPFTRMAVGARLEAYHSFRVALHATSRTETNLDKILLEDVVKLSLSTYSNIARNAQGILIDGMKRLNGSYNLIIKSAFKYLTKALDKNDIKKIESGLSIFTIRKIKSKLQCDFFNIYKYIDLLHRSLLVDNPQVHSLAESLFSATSKGITPPSKPCIIDHEAIDTIRPPDQFIDLEIKAVKLAKEKKRKVYFDKLSKLQEKVLTDEKINNHWKTTVMNLELLVNIQSYLEVPTRSDVLQLLQQEASTEHPTIARFALKGITRIINKLAILHGFEYDFENAYDLNYIPKNLKVIDTRPTVCSYTDTWKQELNNSVSPSYYVDYKASTGWLFWNDSMLAISNEPNYKLKLQPDDLQAITSFGKLLTKSWFGKIVKLWITDNDANSAFQGTDVFITAALVLLISNEFTENFTFDELLSIVDDVYVSDDKSAHIVTCELLSGILIGSKFMDPKYSTKRDLFISSYLKRILNYDLSPDTQGIWNIFSWWIPAHIDVRRFPQVVQELFEFKLDDSSAFKQATRISYIRSIASSISWCIPDPDKLLHLCVSNINHKFSAVRTQIGSLLAVLSFPYYAECRPSSQEFLTSANSGTNLMLYQKEDVGELMKLVPSLFQQVETWRLEVYQLTPQEILKSDYIYCATTILTWLKQILSTSAAILFQRHVTTELVPFLLQLINMREVCQLGNIDPISVLKKVSQIPYTVNCLEEIIDMLENYSKQELNLVQTLVMGEFKETVFFKNLFNLSRSQRQRFIIMTNEELHHKQVEIRKSAANTLSGLIHISPPGEVEQLVITQRKLYVEELDNIRKKYKKQGYKNMNQVDVINLHGATLGLGALVHAFAFNSPPPKWVPDILTTLANKCTGIPGIVGKTAKETLSRFKKTRQDSWHIDSMVFNEDQIQDLEGVLWKSYFI
ncbi:Proteasome activator BLM10 [Spathaspora sp. JA1]|nr:Proteasome activator BLM10 [Spathaspora sp. JA1]